MNFTQEQKIKLSQAFTDLLLNIDMQKKQVDMYNHAKLDCKRYPELKLSNIADIIRVTKINLKTLTSKNQTTNWTELPETGEPCNVSKFSEQDKKLKANLLIACLNAIEKELGTAEEEL